MPSHDCRQTRSCSEAANVNTEASSHQLPNLAGEGPHFTDTLDAAVKMKLSLAVRPTGLLYVQPR